MGARTSSQKGAAALGGLALICLAAMSYPAGARRELERLIRTDKPAVPVVLITLDTVRADHLGCYGFAAAETPALDALARDSIRFANAFTVVPITLPSHAVILTGTYPMWNGVRDYASAGLAASVPTLAEAMKRRGYQTAAFVSAFALDSMFGLNRGFDRYDEPVAAAASSAELMLLTRPGDATTTRMLSWLDGHDRTPFFLWLHLYDAHSPYRAPSPYRDRFADHPYDGAIAFDDAQVGRVLTALRRKALYDRALVIVTSDHGESLGEHDEAEHGFFVYNATLHVPLIVKWPGTRAARQVVNDPVSSIDIASTIAEAAGVPPDAIALQGQTLSRWLKPAAAPAEPVYAESYYARDSFGWHELRALVRGEFKYIDAPEPELYDLERDPSERANLIASHPDVAAALESALREVEQRFDSHVIPAPESRLDADTADKLRALGYVAYRAPDGARADHAGADPKQKISTFRDILRAGDLRRAGKHAQAAQLLTTLEKREPQLYVVRFEAGENDLGWGKPQDAVRDFRAAIDLNPAFDQALLGLGRASFELGDDAEAATALEVALHLNPRNFLARLALAKVYFRESALDKAEAELSRVTAEQPALGEAHADLGVVLAATRNYAAAEREIERGLELGYRDANTLNSLGMARAELGQPQQAIEAYRQALEINPRFPAALLNLALLYRRLGRTSEAHRTYLALCASSDQLCRQYASEFRTE